MDVVDQPFFLFQNYSFEEETKMGRDVMDDRKRALVLGKFKFLYQEIIET